MGRVYQHGLFNIEAVSAKDCSESLFVSRDPFLLFPHEIRVSAVDAQPQGVWTESEDVHWASGRFVDEEPLYGRGWVLQERLLAKRSIIFTRKQIFYRCAGAYTSESGDFCHFPEEISQGYEMLESVSIVNLTARNSSLMWAKVLTQYNNTALTIPGDKLVALSGVARKFGEVHGSKYLAGLWEHTLLNDLMWYKTGNSGRPQVYRAPTWSWASVNTFQPGPYEPIRACAACVPSIPTIIEASTQPVGPDEYGEVMSGEIKLKGYLYWLFQHQNTPPSSSPDGEKDRDGSLESRIEAALRNLFEFEGSSYKVIVSMDDDVMNTEGRLMLEQCYAMPMNNERNPANLHRISLLLLAATTPVWGTYQRVGTCRILGDATVKYPIEKRTQRGFGGPFDYDRYGPGVLREHDPIVCYPDGAMMLEFVSAMRSRGSGAPSHEYDASGKHTITII